MAAPAPEVAVHGPAGADEVDVAAMVAAGDVTGDRIATLENELKVLQAAKKEKK